MRNTVLKLRWHTAAVLMLIVGSAPVVSQHTDAVPRAEILEQALRYSPEYTTPVSDGDGSPVSLFADYNDDGATDVATLTVAADPRIEATQSALTDVTRIYSETVVEPLFIVEIYLAGQEAILTAELERAPVYTDFRLRALTAADTDIAALPLALEIRFRHRTGDETELVVFQAGGSISRFALEQSRNRYGTIVDVDEDGTLDIVTAARAPEAGRGFETFLELHELGPQGYARSGSLAMVRMVNGFLSEAADAMEAGAWDELRRMIGFAERPAEAGGNASAFTRAFRGVAEDEDVQASRFDYPTTEMEVREVTFPRLTDNPFPAPFLGTRFHLVFRVDCCDGSPRIYEAVVGLSHDPFHEKALAFLTDEEGGK
jgi:hypothetical protein